MSSRKISYFFSFFSPLFYLLWGSGEERGRKEPHLVLKKAIQRVEKKCRGKIDLLWLNIFVIFILGGLVSLVGVGRSFVGHSSCVVSQKATYRKNHSSFPSTIRVLRSKLGPTGFPAVTATQWAFSLDPCYGFAFCFRGSQVKLFNFWALCFASPPVLIEL